MNTFEIMLKSVIGSALVLGAVAVQAAEAEEAMLASVARQASELKARTVAAGADALGAQVSRRSARLDQAVMQYLAERYQRSARQVAASDGPVTPVAMIGDGRDLGDAVDDAAAEDVIDQFRFERIEREARQMAWQVHDRVEALKAELRRGIYRTAAEKRAVIARIHQLNALRRSSGEMFRMVATVRRDRGARADSRHQQERDATDDGKLTDQIAMVR